MGFCKTDDFREMGCLCRHRMRLKATGDIVEETSWNFACEWRQIGKGTAVAIVVAMEGTVEER